VLVLMLVGQCVALEVRAVGMELVTQRLGHVSVILVLQAQAVVHLTALAGMEAQTSATLMVSVPLEFVSVLLVGEQNQEQRKTTVRWKSVRSTVAHMENATQQAHVTAWLATWASIVGTLTVVEAQMECSATAMVLAPLSLSMHPGSAIATLVSQVHCVRSTHSMTI